MFTVTMFSFTKRANSTAQPSGGTSFNCVLKSDSSILTPTIELQLPITQAPNYNYAYIPAYGRYYYVKDWLFTNRLWVASLSVDVLATYKSAIGNSFLYVTRSSATFDGSIIDNEYPTKTTYTQSIISNSTPFVQSLAEGTYILGILSGSSDNGAVAYYAMSSAQFKSFASLLFTDGTFDSFSDISSGLWKSLFNPFQYISSCVWIPFHNSYDAPDSGYSFGTNVTSMKFGWWDLSASAQTVTNIRISKVVTLAIPHHPKAATRGSYLNAAPYSRYKLHIMPYGDFALDGMTLSGHDTLTVEVLTDVPTGMSTMIVSTDGIKLLTASAALGVNIPMATMASSLGGFMSNATSSVTSALQFPVNPVGAVLGTASGIISAGASLMPQVQGGGAQGSASLMGVDGVYIQGLFYDIVDEDNSHFGRPLMSKRNISALPGFLQVEEGDVPIAGTKEEYNEIKSLLEGGFYYE